MSAFSPPLTPINFLMRSASAFPKRIACVSDEVSYTYETLLLRCACLGAAIDRETTKPGQVVAFISANAPALLEAHYGVAMAGAILAAINPAMRADEMRAVLQQISPEILIFDEASETLVRTSLDDCGIDPLLVSIGSAPDKTISYESFLTKGQSTDPRLPHDENMPISIAFTSGTTGRPKGAVYTHRAAYLKAIGNGMAWNMIDGPVYFWTLPMFHCNGWGFVWTVCAWAGTHVFAADLTPGTIFAAIQRHGVTHLCAAPSVLDKLARHATNTGLSLDRTVEVMTAGAAPTPNLIIRLERVGFHVTHSYGMTETMGSVVVCAKDQNHLDRSEFDQACLKARQGVAYPTLEGLEVVDLETGEPVPRDGETYGEVRLQGNMVMAGYLEDEDKSRATFDGDWFCTGDLAVVHPDGYLELRDRACDAITTASGTISSLEIEAVLKRHPMINDAAVIAAPDASDDHNVPVAFVTLGVDETTKAVEVIDHCRRHLPPAQVPMRVIFTKLKRTATGKLQKFLLRQGLKDGTY